MKTQATYKPHGFKGHNILSYGGCAIVAFSCFTGFAQYITAHNIENQWWWAFPLIVVMVSLEFIWCMLVDFAHWLIVGRGRNKAL